MLTVASLPNDITCSYCPGCQHDDVVVVVAAIKIVINNTLSPNALARSTTVSSYTSVYQFITHTNFNVLVCSTTTSSYTWIYQNITHNNFNNYS